MNTKLEIDSVEGWLGLPEVSFPKLNGGSDKGSIFLVHKVGFLAVPESQCEKAHIKAEKGPVGACLLPTVVIEFDGCQTLCQLPLSMSSWALNCVAMAHSKTLSFPTSVEFGFFNGRNYAEFI